MAKHGQHHEDAVNPQKPRGHERSRGPNNPSKSVVITTGPYKKPETYRKQAYAHKDPHKTPQHQKNEWEYDTRPAPSNEGATRYGIKEEPRRSGSDSNEDPGTRGH
jgi:hypothetical protein